MTSHASPLARLAPLVLALLAGCSSIQVSQDYRPGTDFSGYRTFALMSSADLEQRFGASPLSPEHRRRLEDALVRELTARGLRDADARQADLAVAYSTGRRVSTDGSTYGRIYTYQGTSAEPTYVTKDVKEGMLLVELLDVRSGELVWRGEATGKPNPNRVDVAVAAVLAQYPPPRTTTAPGQDVTQRPAAAP